jgi:hypothetical protein
MLPVRRGRIGVTKETAGGSLQSEWFLQTVYMGLTKAGGEWGTIKMIREEV